MTDMNIKVILLILQKVAIILQCYNTCIIKAQEVKESFECQAV